MKLLAGSPSAHALRSVGVAPLDRCVVDEAQDVWLHCTLRLRGRPLSLARASRVTSLRRSVSSLLHVCQNQEEQRRVIRRLCRAEERAGHTAVIGYFIMAGSNPDMEKHFGGLIDESLERLAVLAEVQKHFGLQECANRFATLDYRRSAIRECLFGSKKLLEFPASTALSW